LTLISPAELKRIESHLAGGLEKLLRVDGVLPSHLKPLIASLHAYVMRGGKRMRPQLCVWVYEHLTEQQIPAELRDVACVWEIFHAFLLVHDDLIDVADMRRQTPSLHRQLQSLDHDSPQFGQNMAIVAGDLLFGASIRLLAEMQIQPGIVVQLMRLFSRIACTTGLGQAIDIFQSVLPLSGVCEDVLLCEYDWKTAAYTFEGPLLSGAILAGANEQVLQVLSRFSRAIGQAYQLHNDLLDLAQPAHEGCDLVQGKRTISLMRARAGMSVDRRQRFDRRLEAIPSANGQAVALAESLRLELCECGALRQTQCMIQRLLDTARTTTEHADLPTRLGEAMRQLVDALEQNYFASPTSVSSPNK
jgi:geranylgeranyl diphosphate synthase, type I